MLSNQQKYDLFACVRSVMAELARREETYFDARYEEVEKLNDVIEKWLKGEASPSLLARVGFIKLIQFQLDRNAHHEGISFKREEANLLQIGKLLENSLTSTEFGQELTTSQYQINLAGKNDHDELNGESHRILIDLTPDELTISCGETQLIIEIINGQLREDVFYQGEWLEDFTRTYGIRSAFRHYAVMDGDEMVRLLRRPSNHEDILEHGGLCVIPISSAKYHDALGERLVFIELRDPEGEGNAVFIKDLACLIETGTGTGLLTDTLNGIGVSLRTPEIGEEIPLRLERKDYEVFLKVGASMSKLFSLDDFWDVSG